MKNQVFQPKSPRKSARNEQSGNVLILILIAVALFGALSFAMMQGSRVNQANFTTEQAKLAASEISSYALLLKDAYKMLLVNGCTESNISFANPFHTDATHFPDPVTAPSNKSCHLFETGSGRVPYKNFAEYRIGTPNFTGVSYASIAVSGVGSNAGADTAITLNYIPDELCRAFNKIFNGESEIYPGNGGVLIDTGDNQTSGNCPKCVGKPSVCLSSSSVNSIYFILKAN